MVRLFCKGQVRLPPAEEIPMAKAPTSQAPAAAPATLVSIRMLVGQEGPTVSRRHGQELTIGSDVDADEAQRLVDADFAETI